MSELQISSNATVQRASGLLSSYLGDELLMMSISQAKYFNMNSCGSRIWELLEKPITVGSLVKELTDEYDVTEDKAQQAVEVFLDALQKRELLVFAD